MIKITLLTFTNYYENRILELANGGYKPELKDFAQRSDDNQPSVGGGITHG